MASSQFYSNKFDPSLKLYCDPDRYLTVGSIADFTDNRIIYDVQMAIQKIAPDVQLIIGTDVHSWTTGFSYDVSYKLFMEGVYGTTAGLKLCLEFSKNNRVNEEGKPVPSDYYRVELHACNASHNWSPVPLTNKAKNFLDAKNGIFQRNNHGLDLRDPSSDTIIRVIDAMITAPRRQAFRDFVDADKKNRMDAENTKNLIEIESMDIIPELEKISKDTYMGIPDVIAEPSSKRVVFLTGGYGGSLELAMYKDHMLFRLHTGGTHSTDNGFNINFIRMLSGMLEAHNIYLSTHIPYSEKETAYDMLKRIGDCYGKTRFLLGCDAWRGLDDKWKRNPNI